MSKKCVFCGSPKIIVELPYIQRATGEHETSYCCKQQRVNSKFRDKRFSREDRPELEDIAKL